MLLMSIQANILSKMIIGFCLVHGRRNFFKILDFFDKECNFVLDCISKVYAAEHYCKDNQLNAKERLEYHRSRSSPIMSSLRIWLNNQLLHKLVEPNSALGMAIKYMLHNWNALTKFLTVAGASIDNNTCEQIVKVSILHRKNSLFYKSTRGAKVGSILMSLIQSCAVNKINAFDYLSSIHRNYLWVSKAPYLWLPWNYHKQLEQAA
jgi:hypothetical protein